MQSKTNVIMVSSWVLLSSHAVENGCRHYFNMDAVVTTSKWGPNKTMNFRQFDWEKFKKIPQRERKYGTHSILVSWYTTLLIFWRCNYLDADTFVLIHGLVVCGVWSYVPRVEKLRFKGKVRPSKLGVFQFWGL